MNRLYIAAVAGLCAVAPVRAQERPLAPTAPVVPAPMLQNGSVVAPVGVAWAPGVARPFANNTWSPVRSPVVAGDSVYTGSLPVAGAACGPTGCGPAGCGRDGLSWDRLKSWLCFNYSPSGLPKRTPTPYITPLQGLFSCSSGAGCAPCAANGPALLGPAPVGLPPAPAPMQMPVPMKPPGTAGAVLMPPRGATGAPAPAAWQNPAAAQTDFGTVKGSANPRPVPVVPAGYRVPQK